MVGAVAILSGRQGHPGKEETGDVGHHKTNHDTAIGLGAEPIPVTYLWEHALERGTPLWATSLTVTARGMGLPLTAHATSVALGQDSVNHHP